MSSSDGFSPTTDRAGCRSAGSRFGAPASPCAATSPKSDDARRDKDELRSADSQGDSHLPLFDQCDAFLCEPSSTGSEAGNPAVEDIPPHIAPGPCQGYVFRVLLHKPVGEVVPANCWFLLGALARTRSSPLTAQHLAERI